MTEYTAGRTRVIEYGDDAYPVSLKSIDAPPPTLYYRGNGDLLRERCIAIVGSRRCSEYGKTVAMKIARQACLNGFCVVSGMALGIDNFAHQGALKAGGKTIAVLATGTDICYPGQHRRLYEDIGHRGMLLSELCDGTKPLPFRFPLRNRIIAGISEAVVVVEAGNGSGSLITAELAESQGKPVFAVPGNITSHYSLGTNRLIVEGAQPLTIIDDLFYSLGIEPKADTEEVAALGGDERAVYNTVIRNGEIPIDMICLKTGLDPFTVNSVVSVLEIKGFVDFSMGKVIPIKF